MQEVYSFLPASTVIHYYKILESKKQVGEIILLRYSVFRDNRFYRHETEGESMRTMDFTTEQPDCCSVGDYLEIVEHELPTSYWYMLEACLRCKHEF